MAYKLNPTQQKWVDALRSGDYAQTKSVLERPGPAGGFCCLGVGCKLFLSDTRLDPSGMDLEGTDLEDQLDDTDEVHYGPEDDRSYESAPTVLVEKLGLRGNLGTIRGWPEGLECPQRAHGGDCISLADLNDVGWSFKQIADFIEAHPERVFFTDSLIDFSVLRPGY